MGRERNYIWLAVIVSIVVVVLFGYVYTANVIGSPETPASDFNQAHPWILDGDRPWIDRGPRDLDYGQVPFVPAKSRYSDARIEMPHVPNPAATVPPERREVSPPQEGSTEVTRPADPHAGVAP